jgi:hypothetical protein
MWRRMRAGGLVGLVVLSSLPPLLLLLLLPTSRTLVLVEEQQLVPKALEEMALGEKEKGHGSKYYRNRLPKHVSMSVSKGTEFERRILGLLRASLGMHLRHVGGRGDGGVDLVGWWFVQRRFRVLAQCKAEKRQFGPRYVREMEGVFYR